MEEIITPLPTTEPTEEQNLRIRDMLASGLSPVDIFTHKEEPYPLERAIAIEEQIRIENTPVLEPTEPVINEGE